MDLEELRKTIRDIPDFPKKGIVFKDITTIIADILSAEEFAFQKERDLVTGEISIKGDLNAKGRDMVIVDDIISSGETILHAIEIGKKSGANRILCAVVQPVLAKGALEKLSHRVWRFVATDTIDSPISDISVAEKLAEKIKE